MPSKTFPALSHTYYHYFYFSIVKCSAWHTVANIWVLNRLRNSLYCACFPFMPKMPIDGISVVMKLVEEYVVETDSVDMYFPYLLALMYLPFSY